MRPTPWEEAERFRCLALGSTVHFYGCDFGAFEVPSPVTGQTMRVIASAALGDGSDMDGWDHVSVSMRKRCPNWHEMCHVKKLFFLPEETVLQFHPPESKYVNNHPFCLHLWKPTKFSVDLPNIAMV